MPIPPLPKCDFVCDLERVTLRAGTEARPATTPCESNG